MSPARPHTLSQCELIKSIDAGTSQTSVSYGIIHHVDACNDLKRDVFDMSKLHHVSFGGDKQVPSLLAYVGDSSDTAKDIDWLWGKAAQESPLITNHGSFIRFAHCKIGFDHSIFSEPVKALLKSQIATLPPKANIKTHEDLMTIFLRRINEQADKEIGWHYNSSDETDVFKAVKRVRTIISVPQLWSYEAKAAMIEAAEGAGIENVSAVSEAEAAAMTIRYGPQHYTGPLTGLGMGPSKPFTIADMGGGTIDIVTYNVNEHFLHQVIPPTGALLGSYRFNEAFGLLFWELVNKDRDMLLNRWIAEYDTQSRAEAYRQMTAHVEAGFEEAKKQFHGPADTNRNGTMAIRVPKIHGRYDDVGICRGLFQVSSAKVFQLVDKILADIVNLIRNHISTVPSKNAKAKIDIYFVGGASASQYFRDFLTKDLPSVSTPYTDFSTLVSSGALILSLRQHALGERFVPRSLGLAWDEPFDPKQHLGLDRLKTKDQISDHPIIKNCVQWLFTAKEKVRVGACAERKGTLILKTSPGTHTFRQKIFISETETRNHIPIAGHGAHIKLFGIVRLTIPNVQKRRFAKCGKQKGLDGKYYYEIDYVFRVKYNGALFEYQFFIPRDGRVKPTTNLDNKRQCFKATATLSRLYDRETTEHYDESSDEASRDEDSELSDVDDFDGEDDGDDEE